MSREANAGPEASWRTPRAVESLTVRIAAVSRSAVEEDIFSLLRPLSIAAGFIQNAEAFHHQALGGAGDGLLRTAGFEVDLEVAFFPSQNLENGLVALHSAIRRMIDLSVREVHVAAISVVGEFEQTAFAAHFEGLHQVDDVHLGEVAAQAAAVLRRGASHFFEGDLVDDALDALCGFAEVERLFDEFVHLAFQIQALSDVCFGGKQNYGNVHGGGTGTQLFHQLAAVHAGHAVVTDEDVGWAVD